MQIDLESGDASVCFNVVENTDEKLPLEVGDVYYSPDLNKVDSAAAIQRVWSNAPIDYALLLSNRVHSKEENAVSQQVQLNKLLFAILI
mgnify:CR=1 FL=1